MGTATLLSQEIIAEFTEKGYWDSTTFAQVWDRNAKEYPHKEAVVDPRTRLTWAQAKEWTDRIALTLLELGIQRDQMVILHLPNWVELLLFRVACEKAGVLCVPVPWTFRHKEIDYIARKLEAVGIVIPWEFHGYNYFDMVREMRPGLPLLKHVFVAGDYAPARSMSSRRR